MQKSIRFYVPMFTLFALVLASLACGSNASATPWSGWSAVLGGGTTELSDAAVVFQNRLYLFSIGINDQQHYVNTYDGQNWSGWSAVPGGGTTGLSDAAVVFQNRLYLFGIGINDRRHYVNILSNP